MSDAASLLETLAARVAELEAAREQALQVAETDGLTGLVNRRAFIDALNGRIAAGASERMALFVIDLDRFKTLNDTLGHQAGDRLLVETGARLLADAAPDELVARLGGDEFALLTPTADIARRAARLLKALQRPVIIEGRPITPRASVGVAGWPQDARDAPELQRFADLALYRAKTLSGARWSAFDEDLRAENTRRRTLEAELRRAIPAGEIEPWFQPVVNAADERVVGVEVLARWRHPEQGLLAPAAFVPLAEEMGLIGAIDEAVLQAACNRAGPWVAEGMIRFVSCNVSPRDLANPGFSRRLLARLSETSLPPEALLVEITETFVVRDMAMARRHIERLAARGVGVALDDFGAGYSNLRALMNLPIQTVKLDRSLIADVGRSSRVSKLVASLLHAARALGVDITAEGVEEAGQAAFLRSVGCERMQGYLFARPMPAEAMETMLRAAGEPAGVQPLQRKA